MTRYYGKHGVLFVHIPRTGGSWVDKASEILHREAGVNRWRCMRRQPGWVPRKHPLIAHLHGDFLSGVRRRWTVVRHPIPYYESVWKWLGMQKGWQISTMSRWWNWHPHATAVRRYGEIRQGGFDDWVFLMLTKEPLWYTRIVEQYVGPEGGEFCEYVGRTETLTADFLAAMGTFGYGEEIERCGKPLSAVGSTNAIPRRIEWSEELKVRVLETERPVLDRFYGDETTGRRLYGRLAPENAAAVDRLRPDRR